MEREETATKHKTGWIIIPIRTEAFANFPFSTNHTHQVPEVHHTPPITIPDRMTAVEA
jgi:hypothetical protein